MTLQKQFYQFMTFFLQSKRNTDFPVNANPSPFNYNVLEAKKKSHSYAPFNTTTKLNRSQKLQKNEELLFVGREENIFMENEFKETAQEKMQAIFKSRSQRFLSENKKVVPGPGAYQAHSTLKNQSKMRKVELDKQNKSMTVLLKKTTPSMPPDNLGYKYNDDQNYQKVKPDEQKIPVPGSYELRQKLIKQNGLSWKVNQQISRKPEDFTVKPGPGTYEADPNKNKKAPTSCFQSTTNRFEQKKIKKVYQPGPGEYEPQPMGKSRYNNSETHFNSKTTRFERKKGDHLGPGAYFMEKANSSKNLQTKPKKMEAQPKVAQRVTLFDKKNPNPGPGEYIPHNGMTFQLQKALLRKHNISQFPTSKRQVFMPQNYEDPGPGNYDPQKPKHHQKGNLGYKKPEVVNLKEQEEETPSPFEYNMVQNTIQKKSMDSISKLTLTDRKPFNSGADRFKHYSQFKTGKKETTITDDQHSQEIEQNKLALSSVNKKTKKLIMTSVKVKVPFGISTNKYPEIPENELGPGSYDVNKQWEKKTFSIKGKLK